MPQAKHSSKHNAGQSQSLHLELPLKGLLSSYRPFLGRCSTPGTTLDRAAQLHCCDVHNVSLAGTSVSVNSFLIDIGKWLLSSCTGWRRTRIYHQEGRPLSEQPDIAVQSIPLYLRLMSFCNDIYYLSSSPWLEYFLGSLLIMSPSAHTYVRAIAHTILC